MRRLMLMMIATALLAIAASTVTLSPASACGPQTPCPLAEGFYHVAPPPDWDGRTPIGALVFLHGHRATAQEMMQYRDLVSAAHRLGLMLIAPQGSGESWSHRGVRRNLRDENAFLSAVLDDAARRFALDRSRLIGSGFSQGASTMWYFACDVPGRFAAFVTIAGVFWQPLPAPCTAGPINLLHIHGTADPVMPMAGRIFRDDFGQGNVTKAVAQIVALNRCGSEPERLDLGPLACRDWTGCADGKRLRLCLHDGDHHTNPAWLDMNRAWIDGALRRP